MAKNEKTFNEQNMRKIIRILSGLSASQQQLAEQCINEYDPTRTYQKDNICFFNGSLYRAKTVTNGNEPSPESTYFEMLDGVEEEIDAQYIETLMSTVSAETFDYMKNFINDDIISGTHGYSSSKIYTEIQNAIQTAKDYTLTQVANSSTGSYVIVTSTNEIVDDKHLFLISNGSSYDIYALVNGAPTKIGDTSVSLNGLLTEATAETTYLKQADATATYATITTTDGLRTDLNNHINNTVAHLTQDEIKTLADGQINAKITTTINSASTNTQVPSAKSVYDNVIKNNIRTYYLLSQLGITTTTCTIKDIWNKMQVNSIAIIDTNSSIVTDLDYFKIPLNIQSNQHAYGFLTIGKFKERTILEFRRAHSESAINPETFIGYCVGKNCTSIQWKRMALVSVGDKSWTPLTMGSGMNGSMQYRVKNGICYVQVNALKSSTMSTTGQTITSGLPVPELTANVWYSLTANSTTDGGILISIDSTGKMTNHVGSNSATYYGSFSYPVKES